MIAVVMKLCIDTRTCSTVSQRLLLQQLREDMRTVHQRHLQKLKVEHDEELRKVYNHTTKHLILQLCRFDINRCGNTQCTTCVS
jgi:hypothetical protein